MDFSIEIEKHEKIAQNKRILMQNNIAQSESIMYDKCFGKEYIKVMKI